MIEDKKIVTLIYDLFVDGETEGTEELMESATLDNPLIYCHGLDTMLPAFERELAGKDADYEFDFRIPYQEAYGEYDDEGVRKLPRSNFEVDGELDHRVVENSIIPMMIEGGGVVPAQVVSIDSENVTIDLNHPLAGENLHFKGRVIDVRDATDEELNRMQQGCGGCSGGGCGSCDDGSCGGCGGNGCGGCE